MAALCALAAASPVSGHEVEAQRATLVLRDQRHVSVTLYLQASELMRRVLAPQQASMPFLLQQSSLSPEEFERGYARVRATIEAGLRLEQGNRVVALTRWQWPSAQQVQALIREPLMQAVTAGGHGHETPIEVQAQALAPQVIEQLSVQAPPALQPLWVVSYRPTQTWVDGGKRALVRF